MNSLASVKKNNIFDIIGLPLGATDKGNKIRFCCCCFHFYCYCFIISDKLQTIAGNRKKKKLNTKQLSKFYYKNVHEEKHVKTAVPNRVLFSLQILIKFHITDLKFSANKLMVFSFLPKNVHFLFKKKWNFVFVS